MEINILLSAWVDLPARRAPSIHPNSKENGIDTMLNPSCRKMCLISQTLLNQELLDIFISAYLLIWYIYAYSDLWSQVYQNPTRRYACSDYFKKKIAEVPTSIQGDKHIISWISKKELTKKHIRDKWQLVCTCKCAYEKYFLSVN